VDRKSQKTHSRPSATVEILEWGTLVTTVVEESDYGAISPRGPGEIRE
jgi:hypothetical protein